MTYYTQNLTVVLTGVETPTVKKTNEGGFLDVMMIIENIYMCSSKYERYIMTWRAKSYLSYFDALTGVGCLNWLLWS